MKKALLVLSILAWGVTMVFATGAAETQTAEAGPVTIRWAYWGSGERVTISQAAIDLYQSRNPGIQINRKYREAPVTTS